MRCFRPVSLVCLLLSLLVLGGAVDASGIQSGRRANARKLLRIADGATQRLIRNGEGRLDRDARLRPFWEALLRMDTQVDRIGNGLRTRDLSFFQTLRSGTSSLAELQVTWALAGVKDPAVDQDLRTLSAAYGRLRNRYGPEWVRFQAGRPLSEDERVRFERMRAEQARLAGRLEPLRERAEQAGDFATSNELALLISQAHGIATAPLTLGDYLDASVVTDSIRGAWYGTRSMHDAGEEGWAEADQAVSEITTDESVGFVFTTDLSSVQDWSFVEEETDIPEDIARAEERGREGEDDDDGLAAGQVLDLGAAEETAVSEVEVEEEMETEETIVETVEISPEGAGSDESFPEEIPSEETSSEEFTGDLPAEPSPADEAFEEEDIEVEIPCAPESEGCVPETAPPAGSPPPPAAPAPAETPAVKPPQSAPASL